MAFNEEEEDFDEHDVDDGEVEVKTSKTCQTLHEHIFAETNRIIESLGNDDRIKKILNANSTIKSSYNTKTRNTSHVVRPAIIILLFN